MTQASAAQPLPHGSDETAKAARAMRPLSRRVLGMRVDATSYEDAAERILGWARTSEPRYVCVASVNNVMEGHDDPSFMRIMNDADLITADGVPLVWALRRLGIQDASRVYGPDLTPVVLARAAAERISVGFYGGSPDVLEALLGWVRSQWPELPVAYAFSPPYRPLTRPEKDKVVLDINRSGARIVFVGLGCPKQERWMAEHRGTVEAVMVGVGAAFDFLAGKKRQAPAVMQRAGLEWLFRLATEPRRLWRRYLRHNPRFLLLMGRQLLQRR